MSNASPGDASPGEGSLPTPPPRLNALRGGHAPPNLADDLAQFSALSQPARDHFWELLEMHLQREVTEEMGQMARRFSQAFDVPQERLVGLVRACRLLLRSAAMADLPVEQVTVDLNMLCGEQPELVQQVTEWYRKALPRIHSVHVLETLPDFGAVLEDVRVRRGFIPTSRHTPELVTPLSSMTLCYYEQGEHKRLTFQVTPQILALLRARCEELA